MTALSIAVSHHPRPPHPPSPLSHSLVNVHIAALDLFVLLTSSTHPKPYKFDLFTAMPNLHLFNQLPVMGSSFTIMALKRFQLISVVVEITKSLQPLRRHVRSRTVNVIFSKTHRGCYKNKKNLNLSCFCGCTEREIVVPP